ncbi:MAG: DUF4911 domain-containing protein [Acidobacteria bacterium]|jgi:hypothetical protein|nr:MAG: DUF4911 domain-containing protein [Acidobacteriota bacterium]
MKEEIKARILLLRVPTRHIGLLSALLDGSGRLAIVRTKERSSDEVYLIATPHTFLEVRRVVENIKKHIPGVEVLGEVESMDVG